MINHFRIVFTLLCLSSTIYSCSIRQTDWPEDYQIKLDEDITSSLEAEVMEVSYGFPGAMAFFVYSDTVLVVVNYPKQDLSLVQLADIETGNILAGTLLYGNGPEEVLMIIPMLREDVLYISDPARKRLISIDLDKLLKERASFHPDVLVDYSTASLTPGGLLPLDKDIILMANPYCFEDEDTGWSNIGQERILFFNNGVITNTNNKGIRYNTFNVNQGEFAAFPDHDRIFYASYSTPLIEIFDTEGNKLKRLHGPEDLSVEYYNDNGEIIFNRDAPVAYPSIYQCGNSLYLNFVGDHLNSGHRNMKSTIIQMNPEGKILNIYKCPVYLRFFNVTKNGIIYGQGYDENDTSILLKIIPITS